MIGDDSRDTTVQAEDASGALSTIDFAAERFQQDPWPTYERLRRTQPVHWSGLNAGFFLLRHADVSAGLRSDDFRVDFPLRASREIFGRNAADLDGPAHDRLRVGLARFFEPAAIRHHQEAVLIPVITEELATLPAGSPVDFMQVARRIPYRVMCRIMGLPEADIEWLYGMLRPIARTLEFPRGDAATALRSRKQIDQYFAEALSKRTPGDGSLLGDLRGLYEDERDEVDVLGTALLLLFDGTETSVAAIGNVMRCLLRYPQALRAIQADPRSTTAVVRESLRLEPPLHSLVRFASDDLLVGGVPIARHSPVFFVLASANRDPEAFEQPDTWSLARRTRANPMTFGTGVHGCLGVNLAMQELQTVFSVIGERWREITDLEETAEARGHVYRGPVSLRIMFTPRAQAAGP